MAAAARVGCPPPEAFEVLRVPVFRGGGNLDLAVQALELGKVAFQDRLLVLGQFEEKRISVVEKTLRAGLGERNEWGRVYVVRRRGARRGGGGRSGRGRASKERSAGKRWMWNKSTPLSAEGLRV